MHTPVDTDLQLVGSLDRIEERKRFTTGAIDHSDTLCAEADALYVDLRPGQP